MATADRPKVPFDSPAPIHITYVSSLSVTSVELLLLLLVVVVVVSVSLPAAVLLLAAVLSRRTVCKNKERAGHGVIEGGAALT